MTAKELQEESDRLQREMDAIQATIIPLRRQQREVHQKLYALQTGASLGRLVKYNGKTYKISGYSDSYFPTARGVLKLKDGSFGTAEHPIYTGNFEFID